MTAQNPAARVAEGSQLHEQGHWSRAETMYRSILEDFPGHNQTLLLLGLLRNQVGDFQDGAHQFQEALKQNPRSVMAHLHLGNALWNLHKPSEALVQFQYVLMLSPGHGEALLNRSLVLQELGQTREALQGFDQILAHHPDQPIALLQRGIACLDLRKFDEAIAAFTRVLSQNPHQVDVLAHRGSALQRARRHLEALADFDGALALEPHRLDVLMCRATSLHQLNRLDEAMACLDQVLTLQPDHPDARANLAAALLLLDRPEQALAASEAFLAMDPHRVEAMATRGNALLALKRFQDALAQLDQALQLEPSHQDAQLNRAMALHLLGRHRESLVAYEAYLAAHPEDAAARSSMIFLLDYLPEATFVEHQAVRRTYYEALASQLGTIDLSRAIDRSPDRRLTLGYVSADFKQHSAAACFGPVLLRHDPAAFNIICYSGVRQGDAQTEAFKQRANLWRDVVDLTDEALTSLIASDAVDILIDLSGHSLGNRLPVFARKPAPIQVTAWGHTGGTGLPMVDYHFTDPVSIPPLTRHLFAERAFDLPCTITFEAPPQSPSIADLPALQKGFITFGNLNRFQKITDDLLSHWATILLAVPHSQLLLKDRLLEDPHTQRDVRDTFSARGIGPSRLQFRGGTLRQEHLATYNEVDIALDSFPQNGGITTWEALWMGVPIIAMLGNKSASRLSGAIISALGLGASLSETPEGYVRQAIQQASDWEGLAHFRRTIRARITDSPAGNPEHYTRAVEAAYRAMWHTWLAT